MLWQNSGDRSDMHQIKCDYCGEIYREGRSVNGSIANRNMNVRVHGKKMQVSIGIVVFDVCGPCAALAAAEALKRFERYIVKHR